MPVRVCRFAFLRSLDLSQSRSETGGQPPHNGLKGASELRYLQHLGLQKLPGLTDAGLADIADCSNLTSLNLRGCSK
eukprot:292322-Chlamydomonas_euryale.AAC.1